jgi:hypothetical protein
MVTGLVEVLVKCGALPQLKRGPSYSLPFEEAKRIKTEQMAAACRHRKAMIREAKEKGEPLPVFRRGRPPKYTPVEAINAKKNKDRESYQTYNERVREGLANLEALYGESARSTDQLFFVAAN